MKKKILGGFLALFLGLQLSSCGTLLFQDRHGQGPGRVDANVVILDGIGLLFFIVPGLVAFAVDFASGSIYLPEDVESGQGPFIWDAKAVEVEESDESAGGAESTEPTE